MLSIVKFTYMKNGMNQNRVESARGLKTFCQHFQSNCSGGESNNELKIARGGLELKDFNLKKLAWTRLSDLKNDIPSSFAEFFSTINLR